MKFEPIQTELKDGTPILIREATVQDTPDIIYAVKTYIADSTFQQVLEPEEFDPSLSQGREWVQSFSDQENSILLVAERKGKIIGNLDITGANRRRLRHNALIGMGMLQDHRGKGLGSLLLGAAIAWARQNGVIERLWLQMLADNESALQLYKKNGFIEEGRQVRFIKRGDGSYTDNIIMALMVKE